LLRSALVAPLTAGERLIGVVALYHVRAFGDDHARLLERVAEQAGSVLFNSLRFEQAQQAALTDVLTGLPNRRFMAMYAPNEFVRAKRLGSSLAVLAIDLNDFKKINDEHGHQIGDEALRAVARVLRMLTRPYDMCLRHAGDEFVLVLTGCGPEEAAKRRSELKQAIADMEFTLTDGTVLTLAVSVGVGVFPDDGDTLEAVLEVADFQMYKEKKRRDPQELDDTMRLPVRRPWSPTSQLGGM
jgi:diguanylate cyclase (GGDEF)-like protein